MRTKNPADRMGVYKHYDEVQDHHRLPNAGHYEGRDVWAEYVEARRDRWSETYENIQVSRVERAWKAHMDDRGRHHALPTPADVETFFEQKVADGASVSYLAGLHFSVLQTFFTWLVEHVEHTDHRYNPVLMTANMYEDGVTREIFDYLMDDIYHPRGDE